MNALPPGGVFSAAPIKAALEALGNPQDDFYAVHHQGVPGIIAALEPYHHVRFAGKVINHLALAFVPPLATNENYHRHD